MDDRDLEFIKHILDRLDAANVRIDDINKSLSEIAKIQAAQHEVLKEHTRRSEANERAVEIIAKELKPIQDHVSSMKSIIRIIAWGAGSSGIIFLVLKAFFSSLI